MTKLLRLAALMFAAVSGLSLAPGAAFARPPSDNSMNQPVTVYGVLFPMSFAEGQRISTRDYEPTNPGLGFSAGYRHRGATTTVFLYDAKVSGIPDDHRASVVIEQFNQAKREISVAQPASAKLASKGTFVLNDEKGRPRLNCEGFSLQRSPDDPVLDTFLCLGAVKGKFLKFRTNMRQSDNALAEVRRFVGAWVNVLFPPN
jgi:hypothetical protein